MNTQTNWLNVCFDMMDDYIPKDVDLYNKVYNIREKFVGISDHVVSVTNHCLSANYNHASRNVLYIFIFVNARATRSRINNR